jgi:hypothetical protein
MAEDHIEKILPLLQKAYEELDWISFDSENDPGRVFLAQDCLKKAIALIEFGEK